LLWFFVYCGVFKLKPVKRAPILVALGVVVFVCCIRLLRFDFFERLEGMTYDMRVRGAFHFQEIAATNIAFVAIDDSSINAVLSGQFGYQYGLFWPRQVYGRLVEELAAEGAKVAAFDVMFRELRPDHAPLQLDDTGTKPSGSGTNLIESDEFLALQMRLAGNVLLGATADARLPDLFATNALDLGDISSVPDVDSVLRRVRAFRNYRFWHPVFIRAENDYGVDLEKARFEPGQIILPQTGTTNLFIVPVDTDTNFNIADFGGDNLPPGTAPKAKAFTDQRVWQMGIRIAAQELKLDLTNAEVDLSHGRITLHGANDLKRVIPVDGDGFFYIDWRLTMNDPSLTVLPIESLLARNKQRLSSETNELSDTFRDKLVIIGSTAQGNGLTDRGATPLQRDTFLVSKHLNIANSVIANHFIRRASLGAEFALIFIFAGLTVFLTLQLRTVMALLAVLLMEVMYVAIGFFAFVEFRYWMPMVFPILGAMLMEHVSLVTYRVVFEEREQRRVRSVFSKIVSPGVVDELLQSKKISLGGARREVTVLFADVRGFTQLTDEMQERAAKFVRDQKLDAAAAEACYDESAHEMLGMVNLYLALYADTVIERGGTLDKYIGDCVMAFWNAPTTNEKHALTCVYAAIEAQSAIGALNRKRTAENALREVENRHRVAAGLLPKPMLPTLQLGTGINTGVVTVGLMGSETKQYNYTVFGREVNLASRLEGVSGSSRIIISEATYQHLLRDDPMLAELCIQTPPTMVKGIHVPIISYEVPWQMPK
jgi:class 3 adenylate cyclase/CHASE2 domain-containing sensor protein